MNSGRCLTTLSPRWGLSVCRLSPRLTPWAAFLRRCAAIAGHAFHGTKALLQKRTFGAAEAAPFQSCPISDSTSGSGHYSLRLFVSLRLGLFQELAEALQFLGIDAAILQDIQDQHFMGILEETVGEMTDFGA